ncbi:hypothetical protein PV08_04230 [Exophiala spinifera]|uniref:Uncharacterized protein n=1 Tax=Exophiala spinifera TaxID=91928 RepID=A0A0D2C0C5_9EURO|nr:uncharacterized protein PV08_04230 [Exophiala spinifera]KIW17039.1 hypothetical protein PV08_04230 [Exophiala spinifera]
MPVSDLTASRWASPEVRRERQYQSPAGSLSPQKRPPGTPGSNGSIHSSHIPSNTSAPSISTSPVRPLTSAQRLYLTRDAEFQRFRRLFRRLAWRANSLTHWSHRALTLAQEYQSQQHYTTTNGHGHPGMGVEHNLLGPKATLGRYDMIIDPIEAERQFKFDFYEFYSLLERGLVHLFSIWGIVITASIPDSEQDNLRQAENRPPESIIGDSRNFHGASHRFHANVLAALDHPSNPLHDILGTGDTRAYIGVAKEFRNKWKDVDHRSYDSFLGHDRVEETWDKAKVRRYEKVLRDLKLDELLGSVLGALEEAGRRAEAELRRLEHVAGGVSQKAREADQAREDREVDMMDIPFESITDGVDVDYDMEL